MQRHLLGMANEWLVAILLLPLGSCNCILKPDTEHIFDCTYDGVLGAPDIHVASWGAGSSFRLHLELSQLTKKELGKNSSSSSACEEQEVAALVGYSSSYVALSEMGEVDDGKCGIVDRHATLYCLEATTPTSDIEISINVESNDHTPVQVFAELRQVLIEHHQNIEVGGHHGAHAFHILEIPDDPAVDLWRLSMVASQENATSSKDDADQRETIGVYLIHESSPCVSNVVRRGGCFDPEHIETCVGSVPVSFLPDTGVNLKVAMHLTFTRSGAMTLSKGTHPRLQPGKWVVFVSCGDSVTPCPETTVEIESWGESNLWQMLAIGVLIMVVGTLLVLFVVNTIYWFAYYILYQCSRDTERSSSKERLWPVMFGQCRRSHLKGLGDMARVAAWPIPFFATFLSLMLGVFLATTAQFVLGNYLIMVESGNRDVCFFNERCYYPGLNDALPLNNVISNLAYFVAGVHVMCQAFCAETRCRTVSRSGMLKLFQSMDPEQLGHVSRERWNAIFTEADENRTGRVSRSEWRGIFGTIYAFDFIDKDGNGSLERSEWSEAFEGFDREAHDSITAADMLKDVDSRCIDLRAFYALGVALWGLGIRSMSYHVCPSLLTFQFDTCFMIPLANLFTLTLLDWRASSSSDTITSVKYVLYVLTPLWLINFIGTWYDIKAFEIDWLYWIFAVLAIFWSIVAVLAGIRRIFQAPGRCGHWVKRSLQVILIVLAVIAFLVPQVRRKTFSGTANFFLQLSVIVMVVIVCRQMYLEDFRFVTCHVREIGARIIKNLYAAVLLGFGAVAMVAFSEKVVIVEPGITPAQSHDANQDCIFSIFDLHDVWHFLSAIALALFAMLLLDVRVNSWARKMGIRVLFEHLPGSEDSEPSDESEGDEEDQEDQEHHELDDVIRSEDEPA